MNLATLLLVRAVGRQREISVRAALGASRGRIVQMLVVQGSLVALAGCAIGLGLGSGMLRVFVSLVPADVPRAHEIGIDGRVIAVMTGLSLVAGVGFGLLPAWRVSRTAVSDTLRASERNMVSASAVLWRSGLVMAEIALSLVLLTGSGLLLRSFATLAGVDLGFLTDHVLTMRVELPESRTRRPMRGSASSSNWQTVSKDSPASRPLALRTGIPFEGDGAAACSSANGSSRLKWICRP